MAKTEELGSHRLELGKTATGARVTGYKRAESLVWGQEVGGGVRGGRWEVGGGRRESAILQYKQAQTNTGGKRLSSWNYFSLFT